MRFPAALALSFSAIILPQGLKGLEITLNGRTHAVIDSTVLQDFAHEDPTRSNESTLPVSYVLPWMESVDEFEVASKGRTVVWNPANPGDDGWKHIDLVFNGKEWEAHIGSETIASPEHLTVVGTPLPCSSVRIWKSVYCPHFIAELESVLALRGIEVEWREVADPMALLDAPPSDGKPHLLLLDDLGLIDAGERISDAREYGSTATRVLTAPAGEDSDSFPSLRFPAAIDAYTPDAALSLLLSGDPAFFEKEDLWRESLAELLDTAQEENGRALIVTDDPASAMDEGTAVSALILPGPGEEVPNHRRREGIREAREGLARRRYVAVPKAAEDDEISTRLLSDALRCAVQSSDGVVPIPLDERILRFYEAYLRIGRLAVNGQLSGSEAAELIIGFGEIR